MQDREMASEALPAPDSAWQNTEAVVEAEPREEDLLVLEVVEKQAREERITQGTIGLGRRPDDSRCNVTSH